MDYEILLTLAEAFIRRAEVHQSRRELASEAEAGLLNLSLRAQVMSDMAVVFREASHSARNANERKPRAAEGTEMQKHLYPRGHPLGRPY